MTEKDPTGYTLTCSIEVMQVFMSIFGSTCMSDRRDKYNHSREIDLEASRLYGAWADMDRQANGD